MKIRLLLLAFTFISFSTVDFPILKDTFNKRGKQFSYTSEVEVKDGRYYVKNKIICNKKDKMCLSWEAAKIYHCNRSPFKSESVKTINVSYPYHYRSASIYLGANLQDSVGNIECYVDEDRLGLIAESQKTTLQAYNEFGETMNVEITSYFVQQLNTSIIEVDYSGGELLIERKFNFFVQNESLSDDIRVINNTAEFLSLYEEEYVGMRNFLQGTKDIADNNINYLYLKNDNTNGKSKVILTSKGNDYQLDELKFCLVSHNRNWSIAFLANSFIAI